MPHPTKTPALNALALVEDTIARRGLAEARPILEAQAQNWKNIGKDNMARAIMEALETVARFRVARLASLGSVADFANPDDARRILDDRRAEAEGALAALRAKYI